MKKKILLRTVHPSDIETIASIATISWQTIYDAYKEDMGEELFNLIHSEWQLEKARQVKEKAEKSPEEVYVTELDGKIVAFTTFNIEKEKNIGEICNNAVLPEFQGLGIGKMQHKKLLDIFKERGLTYAIVSTGLDKGHEKARASYEKTGFKKMKWSITYFQKL